MENLSREEVIKDLQQSFGDYLEKFGVDNIGIFEEEGQDDQYYVGYTVTKNGKTYHIHTPYQKGDHGELTSSNQEWTIESDDPEGKDLRGFDNAEQAFRNI